VPKHPKSDTNDNTNPKRKIKKNNNKKTGVLKKQIILKQRNRIKFLIKLPQQKALRYKKISAI
jgi:hypothetical protein